MADIDYRQIASHIVKDSKAIKRASLRAINTTAFDARAEVTKDAEGKMDFRKSTERALGLRVKIANQRNLEAFIVTNRGWLAYHISQGQRQATGGLVFRGQKYIVVPIMEEAFTKTKKFKKSYLKRTYIVPHRGEALMLYRGRGMKKSKLLAVLKRQVEYNEDIKPEEVIKEYVQREGIKKLQRFLRNELKD